ncbi:hypothetical protein JR334_02045 [Clostridia bacterium]|nr:hypothetical protein JR334_02045 [Clostridia bacterium]
MNYLKNSSGELLDVEILKARLAHVSSSSTQRLLNGTWHTQVIGEGSPKLTMQLNCSYATIQKLISYASSKETLSMEFDGVEYTGHMLDQPTYDIIAPRLNQKCTVDFELAVTG